jgi:hypothetical protein
LVASLQFIVVCKFNPAFVTLFSKAPKKGGGVGEKIHHFLSILVLLSASAVLWRAPIKRMLFSSGVVDRVQFKYFTLRQGRSLDQLISLMDLPEHASFDDRVDRVREFVVTHSRDGADKDIYGPNGGPMLMIDKMLAYATGKSRKPPSLECSWRSGLMSSILERLGYEMRVVNAFH